jgi:phage-related protein
VKAQYCTSEIRPDYKELISHVEDINYNPCQNQSRKAWFYVQQQRLENRMEKLLVAHKQKIQSLAVIYLDILKDWRSWNYNTPEQFKRGITFLYNMDKEIDDIEINKIKTK